MCAVAVTVDWKTSHFFGSSPSIIPNIGAPGCSFVGLKAGTGSIRIWIPVGILFFATLSIQVDQKLARPICGDHIWLTLLPSLTWWTSSSLGLWVKQCPLALLNAADKICRRNPPSVVQPCYGKSHVKSRFIILQGKSPNAVKTKRKAYKVCATSDVAICAHPKWFNTSGPCGWSFPGWHQLQVVN